MDHNWSHRRAPAAHGLRVGHLGSTDTGEFAIHQIGADLALQYRIAPVADVLQDQQSKHHLSRKTRSAASAAEDDAAPMPGGPPRPSLHRRALHRHGSSTAPADL